MLTVLYLQILWKCSKFQTIRIKIQRGSGGVKEKKKKMKKKELKENKMSMPEKKNIYIYKLGKLFDSLVNTFK